MNNVNADECCYCGKKASEDVVLEACEVCGIAGCPACKKREFMQGDDICVTCWEED